MSRKYNTIFVKIIIDTHRYIHTLNWVLKDIHHHIQFISAKHKWWFFLVVRLQKMFSSVWHILFLLNKYIILPII